MKALVWTIVAFGLVIWSALCWLVYQLITVGGRYAANNADVVAPDAEIVEQIFNWAIFGTELGQWIAIGVWGFGALLAVLLGWLVTKFLPALHETTKSVSQTNLPRI
jgi:hypothetical protein